MPEVERDGCRLHYQIAGRGPVVVLAAGLGGTAGWWAETILRWSGEFTLLSFDQRGAGASSRVPVASIGQLAEDLIAILDHAGIGAAQMLGHSTGGATIASLAIDHPERVRSLLINASTTHGDAWRQRVFDLRKLLFATGGPATYAAFTTLLLYPPYFVNTHDAWLRQEEARAAAALGAPEVQASRMDAIFAFDRREELSRITAPTLVVCTDDDILTPRHFSEDYAARIPGAVAIYPPRGGHALTRTEPALFDSIALPFLRTHA